MTVGTASTYPTTDAVKAVVEKIDALISAGDKTVPAAQKGAWEVATSSLRSLTAGLVAVGYDFSLLPSADQQEFIDGVNGVNQTADPEQDAATAALTEFYTTSCIPTAGPSFTG